MQQEEEKGHFVRHVECLESVQGKILRKWEGVVGTGWGWLRIGTGGGRL